MRDKPAGSIEKMVPSEILNVNPYVPGKPIDEVKRELGVDQVIKLASNENVLGASPRAIRAIQDYASQVHLYPDGGAYYLKKELAQYMELEPENIIFGNGSDEIISIITRIFIQKGDQAIMGYPSFLMYKIDTQLSRGKIVSIPLKEFRLDVYRILEAVNPRTKVVFISNPNNPTGTIIGQKDMEELLQGLPSHVIIVCDEAYREYVDDPEYPDTLSWIRGDKNIIVLRTFSKIHGLAGLRLGYGIARKEIISILNRARPPFNVNSLAQIAARASLQDTEHLEKSKNLVREEKEFLYKNFGYLGIPYVPSRANFILINTGEHTEEIINSLLERGIIVRSMRAYNLPHYIRLTVGTREQNEIVIRQLRTFFK